MYLKSRIREKSHSCLALAVCVHVLFSHTEIEKDAQCLLINKVLMYMQLSLC